MKTMKALVDIYTSYRFNRQTLISPLISLLVAFACNAKSFVICLCFIYFLLVGDWSY